MNTLSSLPPPSFGDASLRGVTPSVESPSASSANWGGLDAAANSGQPLHVSADAAMRNLDDIERDFMAALCENHSA